MVTLWSVYTFFYIEVVATAQWVVAIKKSLFSSNDTHYLKLWSCNLNLLVTLRVHQRCLVMRKPKESHNEQTEQAFNNTQRSDHCCDGMLRIIAKLLLVVDILRCDLLETLRGKCCRDFNFGISTSWRLLLVKEYLLGTLLSPPKSGRGMRL